MYLRGPKPVDCWWLLTQDWKARSTLLPFIAALKRRATKMSFSKVYKPLYMPPSTRTVWPVM